MHYLSDRFSFLKCQFSQEWMRRRSWGHCCSTTTTTPTYLFGRPAFFLAAAFSDWPPKLWQFSVREVCFVPLRWGAMYTSPVWKIQKMVKNPCLSVKNMRIGCEKFQKKFGLNWRFPWGAIAKTCSLAFCSAICPLHVIYKAICGPKKIHPVCLTFEPLRLQMTTIA